MVTEKVQRDYSKKLRRQAAKGIVAEAGFESTPANECLWVFAQGGGGAGRYIAIGGIIDGGMEYVVECMAHVGMEPGEVEDDETGEGSNGLRVLRDDGGERVEEVD